ncbi:hypothetical protein ACIA8H_07375 [Streptomyces goshikiensis]|uniref:hypothetical protein n=1 Tax=Streptomyces goshikiensis TaxID=1942 RepID=UPI00379BEE15
MQLDSITTIGPLITAGAAIVVGGVTRWTQKGVAKDRIRWEGRLEIAKLDVVRFETTLKHLIEAADAGTRYVVALGDIDASEYAEREPYVFALLEPLGRARAEAHALPDFPGSDQVSAAIKRLEKLVRQPEDNSDVLDAWDPHGLGDAINLLSKGRSIHMSQVTQPEPSWWRRLLTGKNVRTSSAGRRSSLSSGAARPDIST